MATWLMFYGFREMHLEASEALRAAMAPWQRRWPRLPTMGPVPITWLMREAARREHYPATNLSDAAAQLKLLRWYFLVAVTKYEWVSLLTDEQAAALSAVDEIGGTARVVCWIWEDTPELHARFDRPASPALRDWLKANGAARWPVLTDPRIGLAKAGRRPPCMARPFGVNLIGYPQGRFGIGEDVRMAARALSAADIPFTIRDIAAGGGVVPEENSADKHLSDSMPFRFTLFCTTGMDMIRTVSYLGREALEGQMIIGFWPWELPEFPELLHPAYALVDQIWASSHYTYNAYARSAPVPVRHMPMAVSFAETATLSRADFGLPEDRFLFIFAYDALSYSARKNPEACLAAFDKAFPAGDERVALVVKGLRAKDSAAWRALERRAAKDPRLFLVDQSLDRGAVLDLYRACDCFVSLHRAEGFGRNIAECMGLGLPVIVTAHSGNMDFTHADTAILVPLRLREVAVGDYPFGNGQIWAEPDINAAALQMRRTVTDDSWRDQIARNGQRSIAARYSPEAVGRAWSQALYAINQDMMASGTRHNHS